MLLEHKRGVESWQGILKSSQHEERKEDVIIVDVGQEDVEPRMSVEIDVRASKMERLILNKPKAQLPMGFTFTVIRSTYANSFE